MTLNLNALRSAVVVLNADTPFAEHVSMRWIAHGNGLILMEAPPETYRVFLGKIGAEFRHTVNTMFTTVKDFAALELALGAFREFLGEREGVVIVGDIPFENRDAAHALIARHPGLSIMVLFGNPQNTESQVVHAVSQAINPDPTLWGKTIHV